MFELTITPGELDLATLRRVSREPVHIALDPAALAGIHASAAVVTKVIEQNRVVYGINTGFGLLANTRIPVEQLDELQRSIVLSHAAGIGEYMDDATVRLMMVLKLLSLGRGASGVAPATVISSPSAKPCAAQTAVAIPAACVSEETDFAVPAFRRVKCDQTWLVKS